MNPPSEVASVLYTVSCPQTKNDESVVFSAQPSLKAKSFWKRSATRNAGQQEMPFQEPSLKSSIRKTLLRSSPPKWKIALPHQHHFFCVLRLLPSPLLARMVLV